MFCTMEYESVHGDGTPGYLVLYPMSHYRTFALLPRLTEAPCVACRLLFP
jgi:hypothetical protein